MPPHLLQEVLRKQLFADPTQWWDNSRNKPCLPDSEHEAARVVLWLNNRQKLGWVDSPLNATVVPDTRVDSTTNAQSEPLSVQGRGGGLPVCEGLPAREGQQLDLGKCVRLCEDGRTSDAVDALHLMVEQGCHVPSNLYYRLLKSCIKDKDLGLGRRIHALTVKSGYEGDPFLATHLIGMYASHRRLEEAMRVFTQVRTPDAYNWATIIFAYARHGQPAEAVEAIRLYRQMCQSATVEPDDRICLAVVKACATAQDMVAGKEVHARILANPRKPHRFVDSGLVNMYAKCGSLEEARKLFDKLSDKDVVTWTAMIAGYAQEGMGQEALTLWRTMQRESRTLPNSVTYVCLLQACASAGAAALDDGKQIHAHIKQRGLQEDAVLGGSLVNMYAKCGSVKDARSLFDTLSSKDVVTWTTMIAGYAQQGMAEEALGLYRSMQQEGLTPPNSVTYVCLLQACANVGTAALDEGKQLHAEIQARGLQEEDVVLGGSLVNMYAKCGSLEDARTMFDKLPERNIVAWNAILAGYAQQSMGQEALTLYRSMQQKSLATPNSVTYTCVLQACASIGVRALEDGKRLTAEIIERGLQRDVVLGGSLVNMYAKCGSLEEALNVFDGLPEKNIVAWTAMISGYAQQGMGHEALLLYKCMQQEGLVSPNPVTYVCLLQACASIGVHALDWGMQLHAQIKAQGLQSDVVVGGSLVTMHAKCGSLKDARSVFDELPEKNIVAWTAMIAGYAQHGMGQEALSLYRSMQQEGLTPPNSVTYVCLLQACASLGAGGLEEGKKLHAEVKERGLQEDVGSSLVDMYIKCGSLGEGRIVFDQLSDKDVVTWTAMVAGYAQQGMYQEVLSLYRSMQDEGLTPSDCATYVCLLQACAFVAALPLGKELHAQIQERGLQADPGVGAALVHMYAKWGNMFHSQQVFDSVDAPTIEAWNALLGGYTRQGDSQVVFDLLDSMRDKGVQPSDVTFLSVLTLCSHAGLVDKGRQYFEWLKTDNSVSATVEHYVCMVDLLGRAGHLEEALQMAKTMPFPTNEVVWSTLLGACKKWKNVDIGRQAFECALRVDDERAAFYVSMANIYASAQMWEEAGEMQAKVKELGARKGPGQSWWTDMDGVVHAFLPGGDTVHPGSESMYGRLEMLLSKMKKEGRAPDLQSSVLDVADDEKGAQLCGHVEKLGPLLMP